MEDVVALLGRSDELYHKMLSEKLKENDIHTKSIHIWLLVYIIKNGGDVPIKKIVSTMEKSKTTISSIISKLEKDKYVEKYKSKEDGRIINVKITNNTEKISDKLIKIVEEIEEKRFEDFTSIEHKQLIELLNKMNGNLNLEERN